VLFPGPLLVLLLLAAVAAAVLFPGPLLLLLEH
jgi:hypothetical protein